MEIIPIGVIALNQIDLPFPAPLLQFLLALDRGRYVVMSLEPDQADNVVLFREAFDELVLVLVDTADKIICDANVERPMRLARM